MDNILIIDDDQGYRRSIRKLLVKNGFDVVDAENGEVGIDKVIEFEPSIILLDMDMPVMNGFDFLNIIRRDTTLNRRFIIAMGSRLDSTDRTFSIEIGADAYLEKPFDSEALIELVRMGVAQIQAHLVTDIDPLTKLYSRRFFRSHAPREIARCKRYDTRLSAILISLDKYDDLLKTAGQDVMDQLVAEFAAMLLDRTRKTDINIYWGKDEFLILSTETDNRGAARLAEKLRSLVEKHPFKSIERITASFGVSTTVKSETMLFEDAYLALQEAKKQDGNTVVVSGKNGDS